MRKPRLLLVLILISAVSCIQQTPENSNLTIENDILSVQIRPLGAELQSIYKKNPGTELLWQGDTTYWEHRSPVMFPINVRIKDDRYTYKGQTYEMPRVGLALIYPFKVLPSDDPQTAVLEMVSDETTLPHYPFPFRFELSYSLAANQLICRYNIENTGKDTMYFAAGGHPGFNCPFVNGKTKADYQLTFSENLSITHHKIANGLVQPFDLPLLNNDSILVLTDPAVPADGTGMLVTNMPSRQIGVGRINEPPYVTLDLGDFPNVNIWSPVGNPYVCLEPMVSHHDLANAPLAIEEKAHMVALPAGESRTYRFTIIVH
jgi:galactose mutarotase-like enzyme